MAAKKRIRSSPPQEPSEEEKARQRRLVAACFNDLDLAKQILAADPRSIHCRDGVGETAFAYVVVENRIDLAEFLLEAGSDIDSPDSFGSTSLVHAVQLGYTEMVRWLVAHGASLDPKTVNGDTAISYSTDRRDREIFDILIGLKRNHPIGYYFDDDILKSILGNQNHPFHADLVRLGLKIPGWLNDLSE